MVESLYVPRYSFKARTCPAATSTRSWGISSEAASVLIQCCVSRVGLAKMSMEVSGGGEGGLGWVEEKGGGWCGGEMGGLFGKGK